jgi:hypothetical protein
MRLAQPSRNIEKVTGSPDHICRHLESHHRRASWMRSRRSVAPLIALASYGATCCALSARYDTVVTMLVRVCCRRCRRRCRWTRIWRRCTSS